MTEFHLYVPFFLHRLLYLFIQFFRIVLKKQRRNGGMKITQESRKEEMKKRKKRRKEEIKIINKTRIERMKKITQHFIQNRK